MNARYRLSLCASLIVSLLLLTACERDTPFSGSDDYLLDFSLQSADGEIYTARISGEEIRIDLPPSSLQSGLNPVYHISEHATIAPRPETVKDWSLETKFEITSYSGAKRAYTYRPTLLFKEATEDVLLKSDAEVEAFAARGVEILNGSLIIGEKVKKNSPSEENSQVTSLAPLAGLREVRGSVIIRDSYVGEFFELSSLERVTDIVFETDRINRVRAVRLPSLKYVGGDIKSTGYGGKIRSDSLRIIDLPKLHSLGALLLEADSVSAIKLGSLVEAEMLSLSTCRSAILDLSSLERVGSLYLEDEPAYGQEEPGPITSLSLPKLKTCEGNLTIEGFQKVTQVDFSSLTTVGGELSLGGLPGLTSLELPELTRAGSLLYASYSSSPSRQNELIRSITLPKLTEVTDRLSLMSFVAMEELSLPSLRVVGNLVLSATLRSYSLPALEEVRSSISLPFFSKESLPELSRVTEVVLMPVDEGKGLTLDLSPLKGVKNVKVVGCTDECTILLPSEIEQLTYAQSGKTSIPVIKGLERCKKIIFDNPFQLTSAISLPASLRVVTGEISLASNNYGPFSAPSLEEVGKLSVIGGDAMASVSLPKLRKAESLTLWSGGLKEILLPVLSEVQTLALGYNSFPNYAMTALPDLSSLTHVGKITISGFSQLTDYTGVRTAVESGVIPDNGWTVTKCGYNPTLQDLREGRYKR